MESFLLWSQNNVTTFLLIVLLLTSLILPIAIYLLKD